MTVNHSEAEKSRLQENFIYAMKRYPEIIIIGSYAVIVFFLSHLIGTNFTHPALHESIFIGKHYTFALMLGSLAAISATIFGRAQSKISVIGSGVKQMSYLISFNLLMWLHFHVKMWIPLINPIRYDELYFQIDNIFRPLLNMLATIRAFVSGIGNIDSLYTNLFIVMFAVSFFFHSAFDRENVRKLILASIIIQVVGSLCYLVMPAVGPFIYEHGVSRLATECQSSMLHGYWNLVSLGPRWLDENGPKYFIAGLAAMPSLHSGASWIFLYYAYKYKPYLLTLYLPIFFWIIIEAVSSRWHYLIDLPVGVAVASVCIYMANKIDLFCQGDVPLKFESEKMRPS